MKTILVLNICQRMAGRIFRMDRILNLKYFGKPYMGALASNADPDEMPQNATFYLDLHYLLRYLQPLGTEVHLDLAILTCDPLICIINHHRPFLSNRYIQRVEKRLYSKTVVCGVFLQCDKVPVVWVLWHISDIH